MKILTETETMRHRNHFGETPPTCEVLYVLQMYRFRFSNKLSTNELNTHYTVFELVLFLLSNQFFQLLMSIPMKQYASMFECCVLILYEYIYEYSFQLNFHAHTGFLHRPNEINRQRKKEIYVVKRADFRNDSIEWEQETNGRKTGRYLCAHIFPLLLQQMSAKPEYFYHFSVKK